MITTRSQVLKLCLSLPSVYEDYPFDDTNWTAVRHIENKKVFAMIFQRSDKIWVNLKADPRMADLWRNTYNCIVPDYHMNKQHWISVILDGTLTHQEIMTLICDSYKLTLPKPKKQK